jgi:surface protein
LKIKIEKDDINKEIYFLDNTHSKDENGIKHYHGNLKELNNINTELYINNIKKEYKKYFIPEKEGIYTIELKFNLYIKDCSYMFFGCDKLIDIDLSFFNISNVNNMSYMFCECISLQSLPDISKWNIKNVNDISYMFFGCNSLESLPDISKWDTKNVNNMSGMFCRCYSLRSLPDISKWNTKNVNNMSGIFFRCYSLESIPDISKWDTKNVNNMKFMFVGVDKKIIPEIFKKV